MTIQEAYTAASRRLDALLDYEDEGGEFALEKATDQLDEALGRDDVTPELLTAIVDHWLEYWEDEM